MNHVDERQLERIRGLDSRAESLLAASARGDGVLRMTHERLAFELGTSREVVTRLLKELAGLRAIALGRGRIAVPAAR